MAIRELTGEQELFESERVIATAFLHPWNGEEARAQARTQAAGTAKQPELRWGAFDDAGSMVAAISTLRHWVSFAGHEIPIGEVHMVASLPEGRGSGNVRAIMGEVLHAFKARGDVFATLIPFSFAFYRKFGFELATRTLTQRVPIDQLADMSCDYAVSRVASEDDVLVVRKLYDAFASSRNLAELRGDAAWEYKGDGEWGDRDFFHRDCPSYSYVLWDESGVPHAYVSFIFVTGDKGPFVGELKVSEIVYDSPEAFRGVLGFLYRMREKATHMTFELMDDIDLATILPECEEVERTLGGHVMARVLDVPQALGLMGHPAGSGAYVLAVEDAFMPENGGSYRVTFETGRATSVEPTDVTADLAVTVQTLSQLVVGRIGLGEALYRPGTELRSNERVLREVFARRPVCLSL